MKENLLNLVRSRQFLLLQIILFFFCLNYFFANLNCRVDLSRSGRFQLTESTKKTLESVSDKLYLDAYYSEDIPAEYKARLDLLKETLKEIRNVDPSKVELRFFDPDANPSDREKALELGIEPQTLQKVELSSAQVKSAFLGISLRMGKETDVIPVAFFAEDLEYQILSTVKKMIRKTNRSGSGLGLLVEDGSMDAPVPGPRSGKDSFGVFIHQVFAPEFGAVFPFGINDGPIPGDIRTLIIAGTPELTESGKYYLDQFIVRGGNCIILPKTMDFQLDPNSAALSPMTMGQRGFAQTTQGIFDWGKFLEDYGILIEPNLLLDPENSMPMGPLVQMESGGFGRYHYPLWILASKDSGNFKTESPFLKDQEVLLFPWASALGIKEDVQPKVEKTVLIESAASAVKKVDYLHVGEREVFQMDLRPDGKNYPLLLELKGKFQSRYSQGKLPPDVDPKSYRAGSESESRIMVVGSPYIISDLLVLREFREIYQSANVPFFFNMIDILQGDEDLVKARSKKPVFETLKAFSEREQVFYSLLNILLVPIMIGLYAYFRMRARSLAKRRGR
jgi:ABC-type uncharacterized transport system involved in gliding motility auxiliary subunit